jgi:hypothetical protein
MLGPEGGVAAINGGLLLYHGRWHQSSIEVDGRRRVVAKLEAAQTVEDPTRANLNLPITPEES